MSLKKELINTIDLFADLLEFGGANKFKISAFRNGANIVRGLEDIENLIESGEINSIKGIGKGISSFIKEFYETGAVKELEDLRGTIPEGIFELFGVKGLGAKKIRILSEDLGIENLEGLEQACADNKIAALKGFGPKSEEKILGEIKRLKAVENLLLVNRAEKIASKIIDSIEEFETVIKIFPTGELRRGREIIERIEILCVITDEEEFLAEVDKIFEYNKISNFTLSGISLLNLDFTEIYLYYTLEGDAALSLMLTTGSGEFLDKYMGSFPDEGADSEEEIFERANVPYVIPEMRETEYFGLREALRINSDLSMESFKGFFHFHTTYSDGLDSLRGMVKGAEALGFEYFAVCDHSRSAFYANGLSEERVLLQSEEVKRLRKELKLEIFQGIESDILADGSLDYDEEFMKHFDFVVASVHSRFNMTEEEMTGRIIKAVENPNTDVLAHPTGRLLLSRDPYKVDIRKVIDACAANDVAIEINANPHRLDLDWRHIYYAREQGCRFSINPDSHSVESIHEIGYGIKTARKGGICGAEVINCMNLTEFKKFIKRKADRGK